MNPYREDITHWGGVTGNGFGGKNFLPPVSLKGRWEEIQEEFLDSNNVIALSRAIVYFPVNVVIPAIGDYLLYGTSAETDPSAAGAFEIRQVLRTPDLRRVRTELRIIL